MNRGARGAVAVLVGVVFMAIVVVYLVRRAAVPATAAKPRIDTEAHCAEIRRSYENELATTQACERDDECAVDQRGGTLSGLDGCARFHRADADLSKADAVAAAWLARGCSHVFMTCAPERAQCQARTCAELPPPPVPRTWHRVAHREKFSFFVPPDALAEDVTGEDSEVGELKTPRSVIRFDYGRYGTNIAGTPGEDAVVRGERFVVGDSVGELIATRMPSGTFRVGVDFRALKNSLSEHESVLTLWTECKTEALCADGYITARSLELH